MKLRLEMENVAHNEAMTEQRTVTYALVQRLALSLLVHRVFPDQASAQAFQDAKGATLSPSVAVYKLDGAWKRGDSVPFH